MVEGEAESLRVGGLVLLFLLSLLMGCGGGSGAPASNPSPSVSVSISPTSASVEIGGTQQFTATVSNATNTAVTWQVNGAIGGNFTVGTISSAGFYIAPATLPSPAGVTITAVSQADSSKSASAPVTIQPQAAPGQPAYVRGASGPYNDLVLGSSLSYYALPLPPLPPGSNDAGNTIIGYYESATTSTTVTITATDAASNTVTGGNIVFRPSCVGSLGNQILPFIWYNIPNGIAALKFTPSSSTSYTQAAAHEFNNLPSGSLEQSVCSTADSTTRSAISAGSLGPLSQSGELLIQFAICDQAPSAAPWLSSCSPGSQANIAWKLRTCMTMDSAPVAAQFGVYNSTAAINPTMSVSTAGNWISWAAAFKSGGAGSAPPSAAYVGYVQHDNTSDERLTSVPGYYPVLGNAAAVAYLSGCDSNTLSSCNYPSAGNFGAGSWKLVQGHIFDNSPNFTTGSGGVGDLWYVEGVAPGNYATTWTLNPRPAQGSGSTFMYFDIFNAAPSAILDTSFGASGLASQVSANSSGSVVTFTATPSTTNEVCLFSLGVARDSVTGLSAPLGAAFQSVTWGGETNLSHSDENNGWAVWHNGQSTASVTPTWLHNTVDGAGVGDYIALGICLK